MTFVNSFRSEWLKKKRSLASWLVIGGGLFTPMIILLSRLKNHDKLAPLYDADDFWTKLWHQSWESMAVFLLPIGVILATGLVAQIEYKNNTWKQLHTTPQRYTTIFLAKFLVIMIMLVEVFVLFNVGLYLSAMVPSLIFADVPYPSAPIPFLEFWNGNVNFFVDCLPIVALQYLISLKYKNFLVPVGAGFAIWFVGIGLLPWQFSYLFPYIHGAIQFFSASGQMPNRNLPVDIEILAVAYFAVFIAAAWVLYVTKAEKG